MNACPQPKQQNQGRGRSRPCKSSRVVLTSPRWWEFLREQQL
jgi:hypothetical protein